jgi:hypothetical protein
VTRQRATLHPETDASARQLFIARLDSGSSRAGDIASSCISRPTNQATLALPGLPTSNTLIAPTAHVPRGMLVHGVSLLPHQSATNVSDSGMATAAVEAAAAAAGAAAAAAYLYPSFIWPEHGRYLIPGVNDTWNCFQKFCKGASVTAAMWKEAKAVLLTEYAIHHAVGTPLTSGSLDVCITAPARGAPSLNACSILGSAHITPICRE